MDNEDHILFFFTTNRENELLFTLYSLDIALAQVLDRRVQLECAPTPVSSQHRLFLL